MPEWISDLLGDLTVVQVVLWMLFFTLIIGLIVKAWPFIKGLVAFVGVVPILLTLPKFMEDVNKKIEEIHHEVHFNDGSSAKDGILRVEVGVKGLYAEIDELKRRDSELQSQIIDKTIHPQQPTLDLPIEGKENAS